MLIREMFDGVICKVRRILLGNFDTERAPQFESPEHALLDAIKLAKQGRREPQMAGWQEK